MSLRIHIFIFSVVYQDTIYQQVEQRPEEDEHFVFKEMTVKKFKKNGLHQSQTW